MSGSGAPASSSDGSVAASAMDGGSGSVRDSAASALTVSQTKPPATADLGMLGTVGFAHWGRTKATDVDLGAANQAPLGMLMESLGVDGGGAPMPAQFGDNRVKFSWANGTPTATEPGTKTGIYSKGSHPSFVLTLTADPAPHEVLLFLGGNQSHARLTATLGTGGSRISVSDLASNGGGLYDALFVVGYRATESNTPLVISWEMLVADDPRNGNVSLSAVAIR